MKTKSELKPAVWLQLGKSRGLQAAVLMLCLLTVNSQAQSYRVLHSFTGGDGSMPEANLVLGDNILYGTTEYGGVSNKGTIFKINTDGSGFAMLKSFIGSDGALPRGDLILSGNTLYGTTYNGGIKNAYWPEGNGTVFKINSDGSGFELLKQFNHDDGAVPLGGLILSGTNLYGTTEGGGGTNGHGTVFKINADGSGFEVLKVFTNIDGFNPSSGLVLSGTTLYGVTEVGGSGGGGTLFKISTDGSGFEVLRHFQFDDGTRPYGRLVLSGTTLYGTTSIDGIRYGTIYRVNTDGSGFTVLKYFNYDDGAWPYAGLVLLGDTLYGTASFGDCSYPDPQSLFPGCGTVFKINTDGSDFVVLRCFLNDGSGAMPRASLVVLRGVLYGTTFRDGLTTNAYTPSLIPYGDGKVFSLSVLILAEPQSQVVPTGTTVDFRVLTGDFPMVQYQWLFNGTNLISSATNPVLHMTNVTYAQSGAYTVVVKSPDFGSVTSSVATLIVLDPIIVTQPTNQLVSPGQNVQFTTVAGGTEPFSYQWHKDGVILPTGSNATLTLSNVQPGDRGYYDVVVRNIYGGVTSVPAFLDVTAPLVTSLNDNGPGTLRDVIANATNGDTITFLTNGTVQLNGELVIAKDLNIVGPGTSKLHVKGGTNRVFNINSNATVNLSGLTIRDGQTSSGAYGGPLTDGGPGEPGGGIFNAGTLTLRDCIVTANRTGGGGAGHNAGDGYTFTGGGPGGPGGGIYNIGFLTLTDCIVCSNSTGTGGSDGVYQSMYYTEYARGGDGGNGGGIYNSGKLYLNNSIVADNSTGEGVNNPLRGQGSDGGAGGGIWSSGVLTADDCNFDHNFTGFGGYGGASGNEPGAGSGGAGDQVVPYTMWVLRYSQIVLLPLIRQVLEVQVVRTCI